MPATAGAAEGLATHFGSDRMWGLAELPPPEPVSWLPATPAWLLVGLILLAVLAWLAGRRWRAWQRERYRREALVRLDAMGGSPAALVELPLVLRATALASFPRAEVASLRGQDWVRWLNESGGRFDAADARWLDALPYDVNVAADLAPAVASRLVAASRAWVRGHRARV